MPRDYEGGGGAIYLKINSNGFLSRKATEEEKELFLAGDPSVKGKVVEIVNEKTGAKYYHRQFASTSFGVIERISVTTSKFDTGEVDYLSITVAPKEATREVVQIPMYTQKGNLNPVVKGIITVMPNLNPDTEYEISSSKKTSDDGRYSIGVFFNYLDSDGARQFEKFALQYRNEKNPNGDIPPKETVIKLKKEVADYSKQDEYLLSVFEEHSKRFSGSNSEEPKPEPTTATTATTYANPNPNDDLPF